MRHILQGFTMYIDGEDFGFDTETIQLPTPTPVTQDYQGGAMILSVSQPMASLEALEAGVKMSGLNPTIQKKLSRGPGKVSRITFRGGVLDEPTGSMIAHVAIIEGAVNFSGKDEWAKGEKVGFDFTINGIMYYRYEEGANIIHELQAWPPKWVVDGIDQIADLNAALGY